MKILSLILGVRYQCPQCSYSFTAERNLKRHIVVKHGDLGTNMHIDIATHGQGEVINW